MKKITYVGLMLITISFFVPSYGMDPFLNNVFLYQPRIEAQNVQLRQVTQLEQPAPCFVDDDDCTDKQFTVPLSVHYLFGLSALLD